MISIAIVTHKRPEHLEACLRSCAAQTPQADEIVIALNPADEVSESIAARYEAHFVRTHRNLGSFPALNIAIANTNGNYVMVMDDDANFQQNDALLKLQSHLEANPRCVVATCNIRGPRENEPYSRTQSVHLFKSGFALYRREVFTEIAGYVPDTFFRAGGETYLCNRIYDRNLTVDVVHDVWMHHAQTTCGRDNRTMNHFAVRNHALIVLLQEPFSVVIPSLLAKLFSSFVRIAWQRGDPGSWFSGWFSAVAHSGWAVKRREPISMQTHRTLRELRASAGSAAAVVIAQSAS